MGHLARSPISGDSGSTGIDEDFAARGMGERRRLDPRPQHGCSEPWPMARRLVARMVGENPPDHMPVYVLTSHPHSSIVMKGGTVFHFVNGGIQAALDQAVAADTMHRTVRRQRASPTRTNGAHRSGFSGSVRPEGDTSLPSRSSAIVSRSAEASAAALSPLVRINSR